MLRYPSRKEFYTWILNEGAAKPAREELFLINTATAEHPRNPPLKVKIDAIHRYSELGESVKSISEDIGYTRASIYGWRKRYLQGGIAALMNDKDLKPNTLTEGSTDPTPDLARFLQEGQAGSVVIYEPTLNTDRFADCEVIRDFDVFVQRSSLILANRMTPELRCVQDKVYTRDIFAVD